jgi:hypothetical protein
MQIRDIKQLRDAAPFSLTAVDGLLAVESMLQDALRYVPYCDEHRSVWSYRIARIILEAASQVDSAWKATAKLQAPTTIKRKLNINDHRDRFGALVARQGVVFFSAGSISTLTPFKDWQPPDAEPPEWWRAYNKLKHDRFTFQNEGTLDHALNSVAALLLTIICSGTCDLALMVARLLDTCDRYPWSHTSTVYSSRFLGIAM